VAAGKEHLVAGLPLFDTQVDFDGVDRGGVRSTLTGRRHQPPWSALTIGAFASRGQPRCR
jgi:hypothetical protein